MDLVTFETGSIFLYKIAFTNWKIVLIFTLVYKYKNNHFERSRFYEVNGN